MLSLYIMSENSKNNPKVLIQLAKEGDPEAFGRLYELYFTPIFRYIYIRVKDKGISEDLVQDVFLKIHKSIYGFQEKGKDPLAYFFTIARNTVIDFWKKKKDLIADDPTEVFDKLKDESANPIDFAERRETEKAVRQAIGKLSDDRQDVIILKFIEGFSNREIAKMLGKSEESVRQLQCRALRNLRAHLKDFKVL